MKILLATDGSVNSDLATRMLTKLKIAQPFEVEILSVANLTHSQGPVDFDFGQHFNQAILEQARGAVEKSVELLKAAGIAARSRVAEGHPAASIVQHAEDTGVDLVVMGAQGHSLLSRMLLGSVSDYVATHVHCSVLLVRDTQFTDQDRPLRLCIGYDDSKGCQNAIAELAKNGWGKEAEIKVVNAVLLPFTSYSEIPVQYDPQELMNAHERLVYDAVESIKKQIGNTNITGHLQQCGNVGLGLSEFVAENESDVILVGDMGRSMIARFFMGSVARHVLRHTDCSVWISRAKKG
jgi:nucleotide-binding universal stress UspA family protein